MPKRLRPNDAQALANEEKRIHLATDLAHNDDFLSSLLVDSLGLMPGMNMGVHYQQPDYERRKPVTMKKGKIDSDAVLRIVRATVVKGDLAEGVRRILELEVVKEYLKDHDVSRERTFTAHLKRYLGLYSPQARIEIQLTNRYSFVTGHPELAVHATRSLFPGDTLDSLRTAWTDPDDEEDLLCYHYGHGGLIRKRGERGGDPVLHELAGGLERLPRCWREEIGDFTDIEDSTEDDMSEDEESDGVEREEDEAKREARDAKREEKRKIRREREKEKEKRRRFREKKRREQQHGGKETLDKVFGGGNQRGVVGPKEERLKMRDFSVVDSSRGGTMLFLGPGRFLNHDCSPNVKLHSTSTRLMMFKVIKPIKVGEELCTYYGPDYFGPGNRECLCLTCETNHTGGFTPEIPLEEELESEVATSVDGSPAVLPGNEGSFSDAQGSTSRASSFLQTPRKSGKESMSKSPSAPMLNPSPLATPSSRLISSPEQSEAGDSPSRPRRAAGQQAVAKTSKMFDDPWASKELPAKGKDAGRRSTRVGNLLRLAERDDGSRNGDSVSSPVEDEQDAPGTIRCWTCLSVLQDAMKLKAEEIHLCLRCFRHQRIYRLPWPARNSQQVLIYPPKHMRPAWWEPPPLDERFSLPVFAAKIVEGAVPAPKALTKEQIEAEALARETQNAQALARQQLLVKKHFQQQQAYAQAEKIRLDEEEARQKEANREKEAAEAKRASYLKGSGHWRLYEYVEVDDDEPDPVLILPAGQTRRGRIFKEATAPVAPIPTAAEIRQKVGHQAQQRRFPARGRKFHPVEIANAARKGNEEVQAQNEEEGVADDEQSANEEVNAELKPGQSSSTPRRNTRRMTAIASASRGTPTRRSHRISGSTLEEARRRAPDNISQSEEDEEEGDIVEDEEEEEEEEDEKYEALEVDEGEAGKSEQEEREGDEKEGKVAEAEDRGQESLNETQNDEGPFIDEGDNPAASTSVAFDAPGRNDEGDASHVEPPISEFDLLASPVHDCDVDMEDAVGVDRAAEEPNVEQALDARAAAEVEDVPMRGARSEDGIILLHLGQRPGENIHDAIEIGDDFEMDSDVEFVPVFVSPQRNGRPNPAGESDLGQSDHPTPRGTTLKRKASGSPVSASTGKGKGRVFIAEAILLESTDEDINVASSSRKRVKRNPSSAIKDLAGKSRDGMDGRSSPPPMEMTVPDAEDAFILSKQPADFGVPKYEANHTDRARFRNTRAAVEARRREKQRQAGGVTHGPYKERSGISIPSSAANEQADTKSPSGVNSLRAARHRSLESPAAGPSKHSLSRETQSRGNSGDAGSSVMEFMDLDTDDSDIRPLSKSGFEQSVERRTGPVRSRPLHSGQPGFSGSVSQHGVPIGGEHHAAATGSMRQTSVHTSQGSPPDVFESSAVSAAGPSSGFAKSSTPSRSKSKGSSGAASTIKRDKGKSRASPPVDSLTPTKRGAVTPAAVTSAVEKPTFQPINPIVVSDSETEVVMVIDDDDEDVVDAFVGMESRSGTTDSFGTPRSPKQNDPLPPVPRPTSGSASVPYDSTGSQAGQSTNSH